MKKTMLSIVLLLFSVLSWIAAWKHGYLGILEFQSANFAGWQVLVDLVIALGLFLAWMWQDARKNGRNPYPWLVLTLTTGSFGPLIYLLTAKE